MVNAVYCLLDSESLIYHISNVDKYFAFPSLTKIVLISEANKYRRDNKDTKCNYRSGGRLNTGE